MSQTPAPNELYSIPEVGAWGTMDSEGTLWFAPMMADGSLPIADDVSPLEHDGDEWAYEALECAIIVRMLMRYHR